jgi:hypothetical protein
MVQVILDHRVRLDARIVVELEIKPCLEEVFPTQFSDFLKSPSYV